MDDTLLQLIEEIGSQFVIEGDYFRAEPYGTGHINTTFASLYHTRQGFRRYIHQCINHHVFTHPVNVMENIERITHHIRQKIIARGGDPERQCINLVPTRQGGYYYQAQDGSYWRTFRFIERARTYDLPDHPGQVYAAAKAFGNFLEMLSDFPGKRLHETIPNFHNTPLRFKTFIESLEADPCHRVAHIATEVAFIRERESDTRVITEYVSQGYIPERITHNDTKLNNVLIDDLTGEGICVIDLDTTMPGTSLYDFGDMVRSAAVTAEEDERDLDKVELDLSLFRQISCGFLETARAFLQPEEIQLLAFSGKLITLEQAIRFLTDYLNGDLYYKINRPEHNLDRARTQIKLVADIERNMETLESIISKNSQGDSDG